MSFIEVAVMKMYISPKTGKHYEVKAETHTRTAYGEFMNPNTIYQEEYFQYSIYRDGKLVQFAFSEDKVGEAVARYEFPGPDISSRYD